MWTAVNTNKMTGHIAPVKEHSMNNISFKPGKSKKKALQTFPRGRC